MLGILPREKKKLYAFLIYLFIYHHKVIWKRFNFSWRYAMFTSHVIASNETTPMRYVQSVHVVTVRRMKRDAKLNYSILEQVYLKKNNTVTWKTARSNEGLDSLEFSPGHDQECGVRARQSVYLTLNHACQFCDNYKSGSHASCLTYRECLPVSVVWQQQWLISPSLDE